jgi:hypothetical protein
MMQSPWMQTQRPAPCSASELAEVLRDGDAIRLLLIGEYPGEGRGCRKQQSARSRAAQRFAGAQRSVIFRRSHAGTRPDVQTIRNCTHRISCQRFAGSLGDRRLLQGNHCMASAWQHWPCSLSAHSCGSAGAGAGLIFTAALVEGGYAAAAAPATAFSRQTEHLPRCHSNATQYDVAPLHTWQHGCLLALAAAMHLLAPAVAMALPESRRRELHPAPWAATGHAAPTAPPLCIPCFTSHKAAQQCPCPAARSRPPSLPRPNVDSADAPPPAAAPAALLQAPGGRQARGQHRQLGHHPAGPAHRELALQLHSQCGRGPGTATARRGGPGRARVGWQGRQGLLARPELVAPSALKSDVFRLPAPTPRRSGRRARTRAAPAAPRRR